MPRPEAMQEQIFEKARSVWGRDVFKAWPQIAARWEHAIFDNWNLKYGPLNREQLAYACSLIEHALENARKGPTPNERYAYFHHCLSGLLNHERVDAGFKQRASDDDSGLDDIFDPLADR